MCVFKFLTPPRALVVEDGYFEGYLLSYAWGKVREHDAFILFDFGSMHNFILIELATKLGIHDFEMGEAAQANGAFKGQEVSVTLLILGSLNFTSKGMWTKKIFISPLSSMMMLF